ncbi:hypothetical protein SBRCBS47491_002399 [Sporothrix bragantina]|uniref:AAA+ ATPase domain-containing protein n=1 Tax=Sporothrix bragantina TaxID=671064 RepID=A0ABP0B6P6_9PEZI
MDHAGRAGKLSRFLRDVLSGKRKITARGDAQLFLEAVVDHKTPVECVESLVSSSHGAEAIRGSVRADLSSAFLRSHTFPFIRLLSAPEIAVLADGQIIRQVILWVVQPPTLWRQLIQLLLNGGVDEQDLFLVAWLVHETGMLTATLEFDVLPDLQAIVADGWLVQAKDHATRTLGYKIEKILKMQTDGGMGTAAARSCLDGVDSSFSPGGRHDNDFANFRKISIYPTNDELLSQDRPFYRRADDVFQLEPADRAEAHLDNQFRLLREDMLAEIREDLQIALGKTKGRRAPMILAALTPVGLELGDEKRGKESSLALQCRNGLHELRRHKAGVDGERRKFLDRSRNYLKHQALGVFVHDDTIVAFAFVDRDIDRLCEADHPVVCLRFPDSHALCQVLLLLARNQQTTRFVVIGTTVFSHEPVLNELKDILTLPLEQNLVNPGQQADDSFIPDEKLQRVVDKLRKGTESTGSRAFERVRMDESQIDSLINGLSRPLSVIQGPPGTGKSFIGACIARLIHRFSNQKILVISFTNHALDQFLEDLLDTGIPVDSMVRLGSRYTDKTQPMLLARQNSRLPLSPGSVAIINRLKLEQSQLRQDIRKAFDCYQSFPPTFTEVLEHLEFSDHDRLFHDAFLMPEGKNGWAQIGSKGKTAQPDHLYRLWMSGKGPGPFTKTVPAACWHVWRMEPAQRRDHASRWFAELAQERIERVEELLRQYNRNQEQLDDLFRQGQTEALRSKRIVGCTTTAAAMYHKIIRNAQPDVVLVEEAGEILESHVLTALSSSVKQLILIGDHKQLRPRYNNYALTVEKGDGYNFNMSLFERLIRQGCTYTTLHKQHRMHQDISVFPRALTYPELLDAPSTLTRAEIIGLRDRVVFVHHEHPETQLDRAVERRDPDATPTKQNAFEAEMCLRLVRYLAQQGYGSAEMVVLVPYLGQLRLLMDMMATENDPILNDLDAAQLIQAGLMTQAASQVGKAQLRISTVDNYQGEESDIVIASLTRSNDRGDIGFMAAAERLNVLITRARNGLILIGNMNTFMASARGKSTWTPFFTLLKERGHLYDGFPIVCDRHPDKTATLQEPGDFDICCPDGGCAEPCGAMLQCGVHGCQRRCHIIEDHSQTACPERVTITCDRGHQQKIACSKQNDACRKCADEDKERERIIRRDLKLETERLARQRAYAQELQQIQDEIAHERRQAKYITEEDDQKKALAQQKEDLRALRDTVDRLKQQKEVAKQAAEAKISTEADNGSSASPGVDESDTLDLPSDAQAEWEHAKQFDGAQSEPLDALMKMIGLEDVKQAFVDIKGKVDTSIRQGVSLSGQRFGCSLLGNPGTGKTTVARLYARFLTSVGVIPGSRFEETTGSKLAHGGVSGCQKLIDDVLDDGGGVIFIDEAYQLTSGNNSGGSGVLDFLLPEVENLTGKIVFALAGYDKQMESFFAHNPGLPSRFPIEMKFADYIDEELLRILGLKIETQYSGAMMCEDGIQGLFCRIVSRRIGRGRGRAGFGNARTVENTLAKIAQRQASRLTKERRAGKRPDDFLLTKEDLIGPEPADALRRSVGWQKLTGLVGLASVKQAIQSLLDSMQQNYQRELAEQALIEYSLNKVFLGNPGTGKTTVAKLYGQILVDLGMLSKGEVVVRNPADFVGSALGESEKLTKGILAAAVGKVLVIDEAYGLYGGGTGSSGMGGANDPFKTAVIDTIVAEVQAVPGDDRCVLLLGYKEQLETLFQYANPGLARRFPIASAFVFEDFSDDELLQILNRKLQQQSYEATDQAKRVALDIVNRARNRPHFGNAGEIDILLDATKARHQSRYAKGQVENASILDARDFDEHFERAERSETNIQKLFEGTVGAEHIVAKLQGYQETVRTMKALDMDAKETIPFNFVFRGPPGTGKTTTARKMGKVFYDMGFLATAEVIECSASDLVGQFVGHTGPKVVQQLDKALGRVLFIDEAYRLGEGPFAKEAIDELVDSCTKQRYHKKIVIVLAGYEADMNCLLAANEGLTSRFPETIDFASLGPADCIVLLAKTLSVQKRQLATKQVQFDLGVLASPTAGFHHHLCDAFATLAGQAGWANSRDVQTLGKAIFAETLKCKSDVAAKRLVLREETVLVALAALLAERQDRATKKGHPPLFTERNLPPVPLLHKEAPRAASTSNVTVSTRLDKDDVQEDEPPQGDKEAPPSTAAKKRQGIKGQGEGGGAARRDAGVSDAVWEQLQRDRQAEKARDDEYQRLLKAREREADEAVREKIVEKIIEEERRRQEEAAQRAKIEQMGVCPMGYAWIKQAAGYRCAGGSHFLSNDQLI